MSTDDGLPKLYQYKQEIVELKGDGKVVTFTTSYINSEGRENEMPITIVMVELDEGPWINGKSV